MSGGCTKNISEEFSRELYRFHSFIDHLSHHSHSPSECVHTHELLVRQVVCMQQITNGFLENSLTVELQDSVPGPNIQSSFPVLSDQNLAQDDNYLHISHAQVRGNSSGSNSGLHDEMTEILEPHGYEHGGHRLNVSFSDIQLPHVRGTINPVDLSLNGRNNDFPTFPNTLHSQAAPESLSWPELSSASVGHVKEVMPNVRKRNRGGSPEPRAADRRRKKRRLQPDSATGNIGLKYDLVPGLQSDNLKERQVLCRLFSSVGSSGAMLQLRNMLSAMRKPGEFTISNGNGTVADTVKTLDKLEKFEQCTALMRRVCHLRLLERRNQLLEKFRNDRAERPKTNQPTFGGKPESRVLDSLTQEGYPHTAQILNQSNIHQWREQFEKERKAISNRLDTAKNWHQAVTVLGLGILALLPTESNFPHVLSLQSVQTYANQSRYETLRDKACDRLLTALKRKPDGYVCRAAERLTPFVKAVYDGKNYLVRLRIEILESEDLEMLDQSRMVELCEELPNYGDGNMSMLEEQS